MQPPDNTMALAPELTLYLAFVEKIEALVRVKKKHGCAPNPEIAEHTPAPHCSSLARG